MLLFRYILLFLSLSFLVSTAGAAETIRIGLTPVFVEHQSSFVKKFQKYLSQSLGQQVEFVQRPYYQGVTQLLLDGKIDAAWICGYPYVKKQCQYQLIAAPVFEGYPLYQSYIIVPSSDTTSHSIEDLEGKVFAFSDPDSNSGYLFPRLLLWQTGKNEQTFFKKTFFTGSHNYVVDAVANGLANGGAVDGYIWESLKKTHPQLVNRTRIITRSQTFGHPPIVAKNTLDEGLKRRLVQAFLEMSKDPEGQKLLQQLNLDGFMTVAPDLYEDIESIHFLLDESSSFFLNEAR
mgnify:CR=1 FL=1